MRHLFKVLMLLPFLSVAVQAEESIPSSLQETLSKLIPGQLPDDVSETDMPGIYQVVLGARVFYFSKDGRYLIRGDLIDLNKGKNLSEERRAEARIEMVESVGIDSMITFKPKGETKHVVYAFTDVDCGYCQKLHSGMPEMNDLGIEVRYLGFPRAGVGSDTYKEMVSVWCADDQQKAMDLAKARKPVEPKECDHPLMAHLGVVEAFELTGTPALVLEDGRLVPGYVPPRQLLQALEQSKAGS